MKTFKVIYLLILFSLPAIAQNIPETDSQFPGGNDALIAAVQKNLKPLHTAHPKVGKVMLGFLVEPNGDVSDVIILRSMGPMYDSAALHAVRKLGKFIPGTKNGKPVSSRWQIPVAFY